MTAAGSPHLAVPRTFNFVGDVLWAQARRQPRAAAVIGVSRSGVVDTWSYERIVQAESRLAAALLAAGLVHGDRVLIFLPRIPQWQVAMAACLHIGAIPVPCVTQISAGELRYRVDECGARGLIAGAEFADRFTGLDELAAPLTVRFARGPIEGFIDLDRVLDDATLAAPPIAAMPADEPALMYFTSGSSGLPKAVIHAARGIYVRGWQPWHQLGVRPGDVIWTTSDTGWTRAGSCLMFGPWMHGAAALIVDGALTAQRRVDLLREQRVSVFGAVATELRQIIADASPAPLPHLRWTLSAGEAMTAELSQGWKAFSGTPLVVGYGQTETPTSTLTDADETAVNGMIGRPMVGNVLAVLDGDGRPAAAGVHGEIAFSWAHPGLMLGYWKSGAVQRPRAGDAWHMTGDTGYVDAAGRFFFVGRTDDVISSAGYRIGPTEVENALMRHPAVRECAVIGVPDAGRGEIVRACVVLQPGQVVSDALVAGLQQFVRSEIAPYKYPRQIEFVDELPRTGSGKISRRLLRERAAAEPGAG